MHDERVHQDSECECDEQQLAVGGGPRDAHPCVHAALRAEQGQHGLHRRQYQCEDQRELADFRQHACDCLQGGLAGCGQHQGAGGAQGMRGRWRARAMDVFIASATSFGM